MHRLSLMAAACCVALISCHRRFRAGAARSGQSERSHSGSGQSAALWRRLELRIAKKAAAGAIAEAKKRNWNAFCVAIVDPHGDLVYFERQDNCQYASIQISQHKARTAARYRRPTLVFERLLGKGPFFAYLPTLDDVTASRGGNPLMVGGKIIGAIGASGGSGSQDDVVSQAGAAALK